MYATTITTMLALAPQPPPFDASDVEVVTHEQTAALYAYDANGDVSAEIVVWPDDEGRTRLDVNFADGLYLWATIDGDDVTVESSDAGEVADRIAGLQHGLEKLTEEERNECLFALLAGAAGCELGGPIGCVLGAYGVHVACVQAADLDEDDPDEPDSSEESEE